jgi:nitrate/TMAO reductase-like tetraheme cytochrome c subunit
MFKAVWRFFRKNPKRNTAIVVLVFAGAAFAGVEWTATPTFCGKTCHIMESYHVSWENSTHRSTTCVECHIPPGVQSYVAAKMNGLGQVVDDLLNRTTMKPSASVSDFACLRSGCHATEKLGKVEQTESRSFKFDHSKHLDFTYKGIQLHCTTCHSHTSGDSHFEVNKNICINCHLLETKPAPNAGAKIAAGSPLDSVSAAVFARFDAPSDAPATQEPAGSQAKTLVAPSDCTSCHDAPSKPFKYEGLTIDHEEYLRFGSKCASCHKNATLQPRPIESAQCFECHTFGRERFTDVEDMHRVHAEGKHKVECFSCHGVIPHGPDAQVAVLQEFDCMKCHQGQHAVQRGSYATVHESPEEGEDDAVSPMFLVHVDCTGCHIQPGPLSTNPTSGALVNKAVPEACDACHEPGFGKQLVANWQKSTRSIFDAIETLMPTEAKPWAAGNAEAGKLVADARRLLELVRVDGSWGVHNPRYTEQVLEQARQKVMKAKSIAASKPASGISGANDEAKSGPAREDQSK